MRITVLIFAVLGAAGAGYLGYRWYSDSKKPEIQLARKLVEAVGNEDTSEVRAAKEKLAEMDRVILAAYFLMAAVPLALVGAFLTDRGKGLLGGAVILAGGLLPTVLVPKSLLFTFPLFIAGGLSLMVRPSPRRVRRAR
jgi:hypothetical protein